MAYMVCICYFDAVTSNIIDADTVEEAIKECDTGDDERSNCL